MVAVAGIFASSARAQDTTTTTTTLPASWLKCYKVVDNLSVKGTAPGWLHLDGKACKTVGGFRLACVGVTGTVDAANVVTRTGSSGDYAPLVPTELPSEEVARGRLCYKIKCDEATASIPAGTAFTDIFGTHTPTLPKAYVVCGPTEDSLCGNGTVDFGEDCDDGNKLNGDCCDKFCKFEPTTQACGTDPDLNDCTRPSCDGAGQCTGTIPVAAGTICGPDSDGDAFCTKPRCDGAGACSQTGFLAPAGTICANTNDPGCTSAKCDGSGACVQNAVVQPNGTACSSVTDSNPCTTGQCAAGVCDPNVAVLAGVACPPTDTDLCTSAACDGNRNCVDNFFVRNCTLPEVCNPSTGNCE